MARGSDALPLGSRVELVVLATDLSVAHCRVLGTDREVTPHFVQAWTMVPGEILTVRVRRRIGRNWRKQISGDVEDRRIDVAALGLEPLELWGERTWDPVEHYQWVDVEDIDDWAERVMARGPQPAYELEDILPELDDGGT